MIRGADKIGNSTLNISIDENLNSLMDSFNQDRHKGRSGIQEWNLILVLYQVTKPPFDPLRNASFKHLTFQTLFFLALGSGAEVKFMFGSIRTLNMGKIGLKVLYIPPLDSFLRITWLGMDQIV